MFQINTDFCYVVNGSIEKADLNFNTQFIFAKVQSTDVFIGSFPDSENDV